MSISGRERYRTNKQDLWWPEERADQNVGEAERLVSTIAGATLLVGGLAQRRWSGLAAAAIGGALLYRGWSGTCALYRAAGINTADTNALGRRKVHTSHAIKIDRSVHIDAETGELFRYWREFENLPSILPHIERVERVTDRLSHWVLRAPEPGGPRIEWDAEIINEVEGEVIGWRSMAGSEVQHAGSVHFERSPRGGTDMRVVLQYQPPGGPLGAAVAMAFGQDPERLLAQDLERFKAAMERRAGAKSEA